MDLKDLPIFDGLLLLQKEGVSLFQAMKHREAAEALSNRNQLMNNMVGSQVTPLSVPQVVYSII